VRVHDEIRRSVSQGRKSRRDVGDREADVSDPPPGHLPLGQFSAPP